MEIKRINNTDVMETQDGIIIKRGDYVNGTKVIDFSYYYGIVLETINPFVEKGLKNEYINKEEDIETIAKKEDFDSINKEVKKWIKK